MGNLGVKGKQTYLKGKRDGKGGGGSVRVGSCIWEEGAKTKKGDWRSQTWRWMANEKQIVLRWMKRVNKEFEERRGTGNGRQEEVRGGYVWGRLKEERWEGRGGVRAEREAELYIYIITNDQNLPLLALTAGSLAMQADGNILTPKYA